MAAAQERRFRAMGSDARVVVVGGSPLIADAAVRRLDELEQRWSRFLPTSEIGQLNRAEGDPVLVSADTFGLVDHLVRAWRDTGGRFDPTLHDSVVALGYDEPWPFEPPTHAGDPLPGPGCDGVLLDRVTRMVWMPEGLRLDPGGLGKGLAADLVAAEAMAAGARGVLVDIGGDLRVIGDSPDGPAWRLAVEHPGTPEVELARVETRDGGVATTSSRKRRWSLPDGREAHHVIDPVDGRPAEVPWTSATALAKRAVDAEAGATVAFLDHRLDAAPRVIAALLADADGGTIVLGDHRELFLVASGVAA